MVTAGAALVALAGCGDSSDAMSKDDATRLVTDCVNTKDLRPDACQTLLERLERAGCTVEVAQLGIAVLKSEVRKGIDSFESTAFMPTITDVVRDRIDEEALAAATAATRPRCRDT